jgi:phage terminase large subunit
VDGIQAARLTLADCYIDTKCQEGLDALKQYQREYDEDKKCFRDKPRHDWTSHYADAFRYACLVWREEMKPKEPELIRFPQHRTINEIMQRLERKRLDNE